MRNLPLGFNNYKNNLDGFATRYPLALEYDAQGAAVKHVDNNFDDGCCGNESLEFAHKHSQEHVHS